MQSKTKLFALDTIRNQSVSDMCSISPESKETSNTLSQHQQIICVGSLFYSHWPNPMQSPYLFLHIIISSHLQLQKIKLQHYAERSYHGNIIDYNRIGIIFLDKQQTKYTFLDKYRKKNSMQPQHYRKYQHFEVPNIKVNSKKNMEAKSDHLPPLANFSSQSFQKFWLPI